MGRFSEGSSLQLLLLFTRKPNTQKDEPCALPSLLAS